MAVTVATSVIACIRLDRLTRWCLGDQAWVRYEAFPILNTVVPQTEQVPLVAGLPFFSVAC